MREKLAQIRRVLMVSVLAVVFILAVLTVRTTLRDAEEEEVAQAVFQEAEEIRIPGVSFEFLGREMSGNTPEGRT